MGHANSRLTPFGRRLLVDRIRVWGWSVAAAAEAAGVSRQTAYKWLRRWEEEGEAGLVDRSSRPHRSPGRIPEGVEEAILADRIEHREGPHLMTGRLGVSRSTIYAVLCRRGLSRLRDLDRPTGVPIRYERDCPGELVHVDIKKLAKVPDEGGWRIHGRGKAGPTQRVGYEYVHSAVDDHSRFAYSEIHDNQRSETCAAFMLRAAQTFAQWGYRIERVMTDNAWGYRKGVAFADALTQLGAAHKLTRPYRPQTNGKVERFNQTLAHGWAYRQLYTSNGARRLALTDFLDHYNHRRPHSALGGQPPITRVVNHLCGKDS